MGKRHARRRIHGHVGRQGAKWVGVRVALAMFGVAVASVWFTGSALAEHEGTVPGQPYPPTEVMSGFGKEQDFLSQLIDSAAAHQLPLRNLDRVQASNLAESVFGGILEQAAGPFANLEIERFLSDNTALISPDPTGDLPGVTVGGKDAAEEEAVDAQGLLLLDASLPLRTEDSAGNEEEVDLGLKRTEGELQAVNPLIEVAIPEELGDGVSIPSGSLELDTSASAAERSPSILGDNVAFYPNVAKDTDFAVAPTPTGVETFTQIRSADAPQSQTLELDLEEGAQLEASADGGAVAMQNGQELLRVMPPSSIDADGESVPTSLAVSGDSMTLSVSTDASTSFPVLLDPVIVESWAWNEFNATTGMDTGNGTGVGNWRSWRNTYAYGADNRIPWGSVPSPLTYNLAGLTMTSGWQSSVEIGAQANWNYYVPRYFTDYENNGLRPTSFIQNMQMWNLQFHTYSSQSSPWIAAGIWDENLNKWVSVYSRNGAEGSITDKYWGQIYNFPNPEYIQSAKNAGASLLSSEAGANNGRIFYIGYAAVSLNDLLNPNISEFSGPEKWVNTAAEALKVSASDSGLGVKKMALEYQTQAGPMATSSSTLGCVGTAASACPRSQAFELKGYEPEKMPKGTNYVKVTAEDVLGNKSSTALVPVNVDHTAPKLTLSGTMTQQATRGYQLPQYVLHLSGTDGTSASPQAGIAASEITVDGKQVDATSLGCSTQNCTLSRDWTLLSDSFTPGAHTVVATVTDGVGLSTSKTLQIEIQRDTTAPFLSTGGTLPTAPDGWVEQVNRTATGVAEDVAGYGVTSLVFTIDGKAIKSVTGTCEAGSCKKSLSATVSMAGYSGGAHAAEIVATDGAGNTNKHAWTINVNPKGSVPSSEVTDTLEAADATSEAAVVGPTSEVVQSDEIEAGNNPALSVEGANLVSTGTGADSSMTSDAGEGFTIDNGEETFHIEPTKSTTSETGIEVTNGVAGVAANTTTGVDSVIRPLYDGVMAFQNIRVSTAPEVYSWKVQLHPGQELAIIDEEHAGVFYLDGTLALAITAELAHDATGKNVPTTLSVSEGNILTLTVHHQGGGFIYPVVAGPTWQTGYETIIVKGPPTKQEEEEEEQKEVEAVQNSPSVFASVSAPQFTGCPDTGEACASSSAHYKTYAFNACPPVPFVECDVWEEKIRGFFYYNGSAAWMSKRQPNCSHKAAPTFSVSEDYCKWVGPDHQPYGNGYHITSQVRYNVSALQAQTTSQKYLTVRMYGSGNPYVTTSPNICNPSKPSCA